MRENYAIHVFSKISVGGTQVKETPKLLSPWSVKGKSMQSNVKGQFLAKAH